MRMNNLVLMILLLAATVLVAGGTLTGDRMTENRFNPNAPKELEQFAFWLGEWKFTDTRQGNEGTPGYNRISVTFDGYGLLEDFGLGNEEKEFRGGSLTVYDAQNKQFVQTWIDNSAWTRVFRGGMEGDEMILYGPEERDKSGNSFTTRLVWKNISPEAMDWSYERSTDGGKTWQSTWDIHYVKVR
jgi:hypothetical protein